MFKNLFAFRKGVKCFSLKSNNGSWISSVREILKKSSMSMGQGDFGLDNLAYSGTKVDDSANFNKKVQAISANTKKLNQHVKEIQRLSGIIGTEMDDSSIREQL